MANYGETTYGSAFYGGPVDAPVYTCAIAFASGAPAGVLIIGSGLVGTGLLAGPFNAPTLVDVSDRFQGFTARRGRADPWSGITPGEVTVQLNDDDGALDPDNTAGAFWPNVKLRRDVRVQATYAGVVYDLGYAYIDDYAAKPLTLGADVATHATDLFKRLSPRSLSLYLPAQTVGARVGALLDAIGWPSDRRTIDTGRLTVPAITLVNTSVLGHINDLMTAEQGLFWIDGGGNAVYRDRSYRQLRTSRGTFGAGGLAIASITPSYNDALLVNQVIVQRTGGVAQVANDAASQLDYDVISYTLPTSAADCLPSDAEALQLARYILAQHRFALARIASIDIDPDADPENLYPHVFGAEIGDMITINHDLPGSKGIVAGQYFIEGIHLGIAWPAGNFLCTWDLSRANASPWLIIGDPVRGLIGTGTIAY